MRVPGLLGALTGSVDYLWDFGRTNHYNAEDGKDHWPIGSFVVMEKNQPWTGRAIGETDDLHFAQKIGAKDRVGDEASRRRAPDGRRRHRSLRPDGAGQ